MSEIALTLGELARAGHLQFGDGYRTKRAEHGRPGVPILRVAEVLDGRIAPTFQDYVSDKYRSAMGEKVSRPGDVVLTTKGTVGRTAIITDAAPEFVYSPQVCYFRVTPGGPLRSRYLYYWFKSDLFWRQAGSRKSQTDMADYINLADIRSLSIILPSLKVQDAIASILGALDDKIAINERIVATNFEFLQLKWRAATTAVSVTIPFSELASLDKGLSYKGAGLGSGVPLVNLANFGTDGRFRRSELKLYTGEARDKHWVKDGDLVLANTDLTQRREILGQPALVATGIRRALFTHHVFAVRALAGREQDVLWLYASLRSPAFRERAVTYASGTTVAALPRDAVLTYELPWPDADVRRRWSKLASGLIEAANSLSHQNDVLAALREMLLPKLMSGEIRVRDAEKLVEEAT